MISPVFGVMAASLVQLSDFAGAEYVLSENQGTPPLLISRPFAPFDLLLELEQGEMFEACALTEIQFECLAGVGVGIWDFQFH